MRTVPPSVRPFVVGLSEEEGGEGNESREAIDWLSLMKEGGTIEREATPIVAFHGSWGILDQFYHV